MWVLAGIGAAVAARLVRAGRSGWVIEATIAVAVAGVAGLAATALDFGGWREPDWRAGTFCFLVAIGAIGLARLMALVLARRRNR